MLVPTASSTAPTADTAASAASDRRRQLTRERMTRLRERRKSSHNQASAASHNVPLQADQTSLPEDDVCSFSIDSSSYSFSQLSSSSSSSTSNSSTSQTSFSPDQYFSPHQLLALELFSSLSGEDTLPCQPCYVCKEFHPDMVVSTDEF